MFTNLRFGAEHTEVVCIVERARAYTIAGILCLYNQKQINLLPAKLLVIHFCLQNIEIKKLQRYKHC